VLELAVFGAAHANPKWARLAFPKPLAALLARPGQHRLQNGRKRYSDWRSAPQHMQNGDVFSFHTLSFYGVLTSSVLAQSVGQR